jgi:hypothetical protein
MPLTPPPNYTQIYVAAAIGTSIALTLGLLTRNTLPTVGDLQHNLPHGGTYRDGTKCVHYFKPAKLNSIESRNSWGTQPWALVIILTALIIALSRKSNVCASCGRHHS